VSETALIVGVVLLAVLVGALLPVLFQLMQTLRETRRVLTVVESHTRELKPAVKAAAEVGESVRQVNSSLKTTLCGATRGRAARHGRDRLRTENRAGFRGALLRP
jgi:uncharacterized protein YoxC